MLFCLHSLYSDYAVICALFDSAMLLAYRLLFVKAIHYAFANKTDLYADLSIF